MLTKRKLLNRVVIWQMIGYVVLLCVIMGNELLDFPHALFGSPRTPVNITEMIFEASVIVVLGTVCVRNSSKQIERIRFLEGILPLCSVCKKIRSDSDWLTIEDYMSRNSEAMFSHGLCPECATHLMDQ